MANKKKEVEKTEREPARAANPEPTGRCVYTTAAGKIRCRDGITRGACGNFPNSTFTPGGTCD